MVDIAPATTSPLRSDERRFIDEFAALLAPWGLATSSGRVYAYVILNLTPVSLDQIAAALEMSKAGAWNAAKSLESFGHIRRYGERGSKRALYGCTDNYAAVMLKHAALLGDLGEALRNVASTTSGAADRLADMAEFYTSMRRTMDAEIHRLQAEQAKRRKV